MLCNIDGIRIQKKRDSEVGCLDLIYQGSVGIKKYPIQLGNVCLVHLSGVELRINTSCLKYDIIIIWILSLRSNWQ